MCLQHASLMFPKLLSPPCAKGVGAPQSLEPPPPLVHTALMSKAKRKNAGAKTGADAEQAQIGKESVPVLSRMDRLREFVRDLPQTPGVYLMKNKVEKIIYVGKAKSLRSRVRSYFSESQDLTPKTKFLVSHIEKVDFILTKTEVEAFLLEASLIKKYKPKYNIRLRDDKSYPYIRISAADTFPRLYLSRRVTKDGSLYFGPFSSGQSVFETIRFVNHTFSDSRLCRWLFQDAKAPLPDSSNWTLYRALREADRRQNLSRRHQCRCGFLTRPRQDCGQRAD